MKELIALIQEANFIWICGNGGSASTAEHFATDLVKKGYKAIALSANTSVITMIANDYGYDQIFKRQLDTFATGNDLIITISCSGTSKNIKALTDVYANVYEFETFKKGDKDYGKLEDKHLKLCHEVAKAL